MSIGETIDQQLGAIERRLTSLEGTRFSVTDQRRLNARLGEIEKKLEAAGTYRLSPSHPDECSIVPTKDVVRWEEIERAAEELHDWAARIEHQRYKNGPLTVALREALKK